MGNFRPKEVFRQAQEAEKKGQRKAASHLFASLGIYLRRKGKLAEARSLLERASSLMPSSPRLYLQLALCDALEGKLSAAQTNVALFTRAVIAKQGVDQYKPYLEEQLKEYPTLRKVFYEGLLELDRTSAENFLALAKAQMEASEWPGAQKTLLDALKTRTHDKEVIAMLEEVLEKRGNHEGTLHLRGFVDGRVPRNDLILLLGESKAEKERSTPVFEDVAEEKNLYTMIKEIEAEIGLDGDDDLDSVKPLVREFRRKSAKVIDGDAKARIDMALAFFEMGLIDDARDELRPIPAIDPFFLEAQCLLGEILYSEGSDLGALDVLQRCLRDERGTKEIQSEARYKLVLVYMRLGDKRQALEQAMALEKLTPGYRDTRRLKLQLQEALEKDGDLPAEHNPKKAMG